MFKVDNYYYTDSSYQLELNLQCIRRELIAMLEDFERNDCTNCKQLKCSCSEPKPTLSDSGRNSQASCKSSHSKQDPAKEAPSADLLPKPEWDEVKKATEPEKSIPDKSTKDVEAWVRSVTPSAPPYVPEYNRYDDDLIDQAFNWSGLKSAWDGKKHSLELLGNVSGVDAFFRSFRKPTLSRSSAQTNVSYMSSKLAAAFKVKPKKSYEYTYF
ncbi:unnamed protein product, partial [Iphiclides podalirius]